MWRMTGIAFLIVMVLAESGCGSGAASQQKLEEKAAEISISMLSPTSAITGSPDLTLSIAGQNFDGAGVIRSRAVWTSNGTMTPLSTIFVSSNQLTAVIPAALLSNPISAQVSVQDWDSIENVVHAASNFVGFSVSKPLRGSPSIASLSPTSAAPGSPDLTLTITGSYFADASVSPNYHSSAVWSVNRTDTYLSTTFVNSTQLTAVIPAALLISSTVATVRVEIWFKADDAPKAVSNSLSFNVSSAAPTVAISPAADTLGFNSVRQFLATSSRPDTAVTWSLEEGEGGGSVTSGGVYTAPSTSGIFHVTASSIGQPADNATATVTVVKSGFTSRGSMHLARSGHVATLLNDGKVLIVSPDGSAELFDPATALFSLTGSMITPRYGATFTLLSSGKVLAVGGFGPGDSSLPRLNSAELYEPLTGTFGATGNMVDARVLHTATLLKDGKVLIAGGTREGGGGGAAIASAEIYDPSTGTFTPTGSMNTGRAQHTATLLTTGDVLIAGGWNGHAADAPDDPPWDPLFAELFDPSSGIFKSTGSMSATRMGHTATRLADGKVLLFGGIPGVQNIHTQLPVPRCAEIFDPATQTFSGLDDLTIPRQGYTVTLLNSGEVLLAGGKILDLVVPTAELLNPTTGALSATGGLGTERVGHSATLLNDGRVLITGGTDSNGNALAIAELYE